MEDTIELREIIEIILKGKWIIAGVTVICMLFAGIASWFILPEKYESTAIVQIKSDIQDTGVVNNFVATEFTPQVFAQRLGNESLLNNEFKQMGIKNKYFSDNLKVVTEEDILTLTYTSNSPENAQKELQAIIDFTKKEMNNVVQAELETLISSYNNEAETLSGEVEILINEYNSIVRTNKLPELLILQTILSTGITLNLSEEQIEALSSVDGAIQNRLLQLQVNIQVKAEEYNKVLANYQSAKTEQKSFRSEPYFQEIIVPTLEEEASSPNKVLNLAIGFILGVMLGIGVVFFRNYWRYSTPIKS